MFKELRADFVGSRDEAMRQTRKLQKAINAERENVDKLMIAK